MLGHGCATRSCVCAEQANKPFFIRQMNMCADKYVCVCVCSKLLLIETRKLGEFAYRKAIMNKERVQIKKYPLLPLAHSQFDCVK